jgi:ABC-2 type transport system permease protein
MKSYVSTTLLFAFMQLKRSFRDPITLIVLFAIPILLLLLFGAFLRNTNNISLRVAIVNNSQAPFAGEFVTSLEKVKVFKLSDKKLTLEQAKTEMTNDSLDGIIELPAGFGEVKQGVPSGAVKLYYDKADNQTGDIVASVMRSVTDDTNQRLTGARTPLTIERTPINLAQASAFDTIFAMFTGMAIMMVGIFGVASSLASDKKTGILRRLRTTPLRASQVMGGMTLSYAGVGVVAIGLMTALAIMVFNFEMRGDWLAYGVFVLIAMALMLGFGLAIGGLAKNSTQADIYGQVVFMSSMAFGGIWFPRALLPEWLQNITSFLPLTPVVDGIRAITVEGMSLLAVGPELAVMAGWMVVVYAVGVRMFRWE